MTILVARRVLEANVDALLEQYHAIPEIKKPRYMLACTKCDALCTIGVDCACCRNIGRTFKVPLPLPQRKGKP